MHADVKGPTPEHEQRLDEVIGAYLQAVAAGAPPDSAEWLARHPDLAGDLAQFLADQEAVGRLAAPLRTLRPAGITNMPTVNSRTVNALEALGREVGRRPVVPALGPYDLLREVGRGGMGVVYQARHRALGRLVAVKMIQAGAYAGPEERARFREEARAAARLQHPNIVQIFEVGDEDGRPYIVLEYVEGGSLAQRANGNPLPAPEAARLVETLARAVHYAHERGVVHRDLKPANILLDGGGPVAGGGEDAYHVGSPAGGQAASRSSPAARHRPPATPKITDFGLAKRLDEDRGHRTATGALVGTPSYMAPEQAEGRVREVGPATDVYALGVILYELLTGRPPFKGPTQLDTLQQVVGEQPVSPRRLQPGVPRDLETVCLKCLEKEPARRYASAADLAEDLGRFLADQPVRARRVGAAERLWRWCRRQPALAGLSAALALSLVVGFAVVTWQWRLAEANFRETDRLRKVAETHLAESKRQRARAEANFAEAKRQRANSQEDFRLAHQAVKEFVIRLSEVGLPDVPGLQPVRKKLLETARAYYEDFLRRHGGDPALRAELAETHFRLAMVVSAIGSKEEAIRVYRGALALYADLLRAAPGKRSFEVRRANIHNNMALQLEALGRWPEAVTSLREARSLYEKLLQTRPNDLALLHELASTNNNLGAVFATTDQPALALGSFEQARAVQEQLLKARPDDPAFQSRLASSLNNIGVQLDRLGRHRDGLKRLIRAGEMREALANRYPRNLQYQSDLAESFRNVGERHHLDGHTAKALELLDKGQAILEKLVADNPSVTQYQNQLAASLGVIGRVQLEGKPPRPALALTTFEKAVDVEKKLIRRHPTVPYFQSELGKHYFHIAQCQFRLGHRDEELHSYEQARDVEVALVKAHPDHAPYHSELGKTLNNLGLTQWQLGRKAEARRTLRQAARQQRQALARAPHVSDYRRSLGNHYAALADLEREMGLLDEAVAATRERMNLWPGNPAELYRAGRGFALAASQVGKGRPTPDAADEARRRRYAGLALDALRRAVAAGFKDRGRLEKDQALEVLRQRDDFKQLLNDLARNGSPPGG